MLAAMCSACNRETIIIDGKRAWPQSVSAPASAPDMPPDVAIDFEEARLIHSASPRGAAALLRLALEKLVAHLGASASNINGAIAELVASGQIPPTLQQALDTVRVIGNEAVHPGTMDLRDDAQTVAGLFTLLNFIVTKAITEPAEIAKIYGQLPPAKLQGIADRDKPKP